MSRGAFDQGVAKREGVRVDYAGSLLISLHCIQAKPIQPAKKKKKRIDTRRNRVRA